MPRGPKGGSETQTLRVNMPSVPLIGFQNLNRDGDRKAITVTFKDRTSRISVNNSTNLDRDFKRRIKMAQGDDVVVIPPVTGTGANEAIVIMVGKNALPPIRTGGRNLRINVRSGKTTFSVAVDKINWDLRIVEDA